MARKLCVRALAIKASYEKSIPNANDAETPGHAAMYHGTERSDKLAMARALNGHLSRCRVCT